MAHNAMPFDRISFALLPLYHSAAGERIAIEEQMEDQSIVERDGLSLTGCLIPNR
jgi:hypothetical protein